MSAWVSRYHLCYLALVDLYSRWQVGNSDRQGKGTELWKEVGESRLLRM